MGNKTLVYKQKVHDNLNVDEWFEMRDLKNEIAHDYEDNDEMIISILKTIY